MDVGNGKPPAAMKSAGVAGRVIHMSLDIMLIPPGHPVSFGDLGPTDAAL